MDWGVTTLQVSTKHKTYFIHGAHTLPWFGTASFVSALSKHSPLQWEGRTARSKLMTLLYCMAATRAQMPFSPMWLRCGGVSAGLPFPPHALTYPEVDVSEALVLLQSRRQGPSSVVTDAIVLQGRQCHPKRRTSRFCCYWASCLPTPQRAAGDEHKGSKLRGCRSAPVLSRELQRRRRSNGCSAVDASVPFLHRTSTKRTWRPRLVRLSFSCNATARAATKSVPMPLSCARGVSGAKGEATAEKDLREGGVSRDCRSPPTPPPMPKCHRHR